MLMDAPVEEVTSYATRSREQDLRAVRIRHDSTTILRFEGGQVGKVASVIDCLQPYYFHTHLVGQRGQPPRHEAPLGEARALTRRAWSTLATHLVDSGDVKDHPYQPQFQAFVDATRRPAGRCRSRTSTRRSRPTA